MGPSSTLDLARKRLSSFMEMHKATIDEVATLLNLDKARLESLRTTPSSSHIYTEAVIQALAPDNADYQVGRLNELRGVSGEGTGKATPAAVEDTETIQDIAINTVQALKTDTGKQWPEIGKMLGYAGGTAIPTMISNHKNGKFGEKAARTLLDRIEEHQRNELSKPTTSKQAKKTQKAQVKNGAPGKVQQKSAAPAPQAEPDPAADHVNHPPHYTGHPSGIECIQITEHMNFCLGNAMTHLWQAGLKGNPEQDLEQAQWYIRRELERLRQEEAAPA